jgi:hypothetical protein
VNKVSRRGESTASLFVSCIAPIALGLHCGMANADEWTLSKPISHLLFEGETTNKTIYFETPSGSWSAPGCPNARYVMVRGIDGFKEMLAIALAAKTTATHVTFFGSCMSADYFSAHYIVMD